MDERALVIWTRRRSVRERLRNLIFSVPRSKMVINAVVAIDNVMRGTRRYIHRRWAQRLLTEIPRQHHPQHSRTVENAFLSNVIAEESCDEAHSRWMT